MGKGLCTFKHKKEGSQLSNRVGCGAICFQKNPCREEEF
ncbi:unnamed protein product [Amoebophrya sp. A25]|nr:unnamed protein product [Amoebophrya sp. A25]|eukprot:GSA25T00004762001.1